MDQLFKKRKTKTSNNAILSRRLISVVQCVAHLHFPFMINDGQNSARRKNDKHDLDSLFCSNCEQEGHVETNRLFGVSRHFQ